MKEVKAYLRSLFDQEFYLTGIKTALVVGSLLFLINHGAAFLRGEMSFERWLSVFLSYLMPYLVNVHGQQAARRKFLQVRYQNQKSY